MPQRIGRDDDVAGTARDLARFEVDLDSDRRRQVSDDGDASPCTEGDAREARQVEGQALDDEIPVGEEVVIREVRGTRLVVESDNEQI